jgi:hypothetical protein
MHRLFSNQRHAHALHLYRCTPTSLSQLGEDTCMQQCKEADNCMLF